MITTKHSKLGASSYSRWKNCPGSIRLSEGIESVSSSFAIEGTLAHEVAADLLNGKKIDSSNKDITEEMLEAVQVYIDCIHDDKKNCTTMQLVEVAFDLSKLYNDLYGTADCVIYYPIQKKLAVYDYKHGKGIPVEVENNSQLQYYALGALIANPTFKVETVEIVVVQPRCRHPHGPIRRWSVTSMQILDFAGQLIKDAKVTEDPFAAVVPGDWCRFCPAASVCPKIKEKAMEIAKKEFSVISGDKKVEVLSPAELSKSLEWVPMLESWIKSIRQYAYTEAVKGRAPDGWKLVAKKANRSWVDEKKAHLYIENNFKFNDLDITETKLKSPPKIEKLIGKDKLGKLVDHIEKKSSGNTLVIVSDKRPEVKLDAATDFDIFT